MRQSFNTTSELGERRVSLRGVIGRLDEFELNLKCRKWCSYLMSCVGNKALLFGNLSLEAIQQVIYRGDERHDFLGIVFTVTG